MVPKSFGEFGHYRGDSVQENREHEMYYAGADACKSCHKDLAFSYGRDHHKDLSCETCHGPGQTHADNPSGQKIASPDTREFCALCHAYNPSRPQTFPQVNLAKHWAEEWGKEKCTTCHDPHAPGQE